MQLIGQASNSAFQSRLCKWKMLNALSWSLAHILYIYMVYWSSILQPKIVNSLTLHFITVLSVKYFRSLDYLMHTVIDTYFLWSYNLHFLLDCFRCLSFWLRILWDFNCSSFMISRFSWNSSHFRYWLFYGNNYKKFEACF